MLWRDDLGSFNVSLACDNARGIIVQCPLARAHLPLHISWYQNCLRMTAGRLGDFFISGGLKSCMLELCS